MSRPPLVRSRKGGPIGAARYVQGANIASRAVMAFSTLAFTASRSNAAGACIDSLTVVFVPPYNADCVLKTYFLSRTGGDAAKSD